MLYSYVFPPGIGFKMHLYLFMFDLGKHRVCIMQAIIHSTRMGFLSNKQGLRDLNCALFTFTSWTSFRFKL